MSTKHRECRAPARQRQHLRHPPLGSCSLGSPPRRPLTLADARLADPDLIICGKLPGIAIARVGPRHDGQCVGYACDSFVNPAVLARICDECNYGSFEGRCVITGEPGVADAYYCKECVKLEKDRDGCPKIINLGSARTVRKKHRLLAACASLAAWLLQLSDHSAGCCRTCSTSARSMASRSARTNG